MIASSSRLIARDALAEFIRDAAKSIDEAYWFVVRGECDVSLCTHTLLSPEEYTEVLYHAGLISLGKHGYAYSEDTWRGFLRDYALFGHGELGVAEVTKTGPSLTSLRLREVQPILPPERTCSSYELAATTKTALPPLHLRN